MTADEASLQDLCDRRGWTVSGEIRSTPTAVCAEVEVDDEGTGGLIWVWPSRSAARRNEIALSRRYAGQLFAAPELLEAGETWALTDRIDGVPFEEHLENNGVGSLAELGEENQRQLAKTAGTLARKLHEIEVESAYGDLLDGEEANLSGFAGRWQTFNGYCAARLEQDRKSVV